MNIRRSMLVAPAIMISAATPALAATGEPFTVTPAGEQFPNGFSASVNASGTTAFAWTQRRSVRFRARSAGGRLGRAATVSTSGRVPFVPQVALDRRGNAVVAWHEQTGGTSFSLYAARRPRGGRFGAPQRLGGGHFGVASSDDQYPLLSFDARGNALVAWRSPKAYVYVAWAAPGRRFGTTQRLVGLTPMSISFRDDATVALFVARLQGRISEATAVPRGRFAYRADPFQVPPGVGGIADVDASQAPDSTALAVWREGYGGDPGAGPDPGAVHAAIRQRGGTFGAEQVISEPRDCNGSPAHAALRATGAVTTGDEALVTWEQCVGDSQAPGAVLARRWSPAAGWDPIVELGAPGGRRLAPDGSGNIAMTWLAGDRSIAVSAMRAGGTFAPVEQLRSRGDARRTGPRITAAGDRVVVIWGSGDGYQASVGTTAP